MNEEPVSEPRERFVRRMRELREQHYQAKPKLQSWLARVDSVLSQFMRWLEDADVPYRRYILDCDDPVVGRYSTGQLHIIGACFTIQIVPVSVWARHSVSCIDFRCAGTTRRLARPDPDELSEDEFWELLLGVLPGI